ncbi:MAG: phosphotransferase, partial [Bdellovibrio sp.]
MPDELRPADLPQIGRRIAELHILGAQEVFHQRPRWGFDVRSNLDENLERISPELRHRYREVAFALADGIQELGEFSPSIRLHGDLHRGNLLNDGREFFFVDFDDCMQGPPFQDLWMLWLALDTDERSLLQDAYDEFFE